MLQFSDFLTAVVLAVYLVMLLLALSFLLGVTRMTSLWGAVLSLIGAGAAMVLFSIGSPFTTPLSNLIFGLLPIALAFAHILCMMPKAAESKPLE